MTGKMKSRRWWIVVWSIVLLSSMIFYSIKMGYDAGWMAGTMAVLAGIPVSYITFTTIKKKDGS